jgi:hypothetical protein
VVTVDTSFFMRAPRWYSARTIAYRFRKCKSISRMAYYPANQIKDDTFRKVAIRLKQAGLTVRAKTGYFSR